MIKIQLNLSFIVIVYNIKKNNRLKPIESGFFCYFVTNHSNPLQIIYFQFFFSI